MWKRRKEETPTETPREAATRPAGGFETPQAAPAPAPPAPRVTRTEATIGKSVRIKGNLYAEEDLYLDGQIEGTLDLPKNRLTIGKSGKVQATIKAREVDVHGTVNGDIEASSKITIRSAANLVGNLKSATISIEDGAYFKGSIDIVRAAPAKPAPPPAPKPAGQPKTETSAPASKPAAGQPAPRTTGKA